MSDGAGTVLALALLIMYFAPAMLAWHEKHPQRAAIFALNSLLGWTLLGWIIALVWALTRSPQCPQK